MSLDLLKNIVKQKRAELQIDNSKSFVCGSDIVKKRIIQQEEDEKNSQKKLKDEENDRLNTLSDYLDRKKKVKNSLCCDIENNETNNINIKNSETVLLNKNEVIRKLRQLHEPITLFGEDDEARYLRMQKFEMEEESEDMKAGQQTVLTLESANKKHEMDDDSDNEGKFGNKIDDPSGESVQIVSKWIKRMLKAWATDIQSYPDEVKMTPKGRQVILCHRQTKKDLKPLLKRLRERSLATEMLEKLRDMVVFAEQKKYREAHDKYIELAIGKAAWPMGVTQVGIHERAGRTKIFTSQIAHILNDETTRKYIQMFKRLLSFCQKIHPTDPSNMVHLSTEDLFVIPSHCK
eukprot:GHVL01007236.1.p1 GENE.GHVL01007236.1~~GHVL01007236.1.p1  ORF type:complete len:348 (+),score=89.82 GHVL01007236.1:70-1113(+)